MAYLAAKPRGVKGKHEYRPKDWGFDVAALRESAKPYTDHFGVALED